MTRLALLVVLAVLASAAAAAPLKGLCDSFEPLRKLDGLSYIKPVIRIESDRVKPEEVVFTIAAKAGPIRVTPDADGQVRIPLTEALCKENPDISNNQPPDSLGISISIDPHVPPARSLEYRELAKLREQWETAVARQGFFYRMLAPTAKAFRVMFDPGTAATAEIRLPEGTRKIVADAGGKLVIPFEPSWVQANPRVVFSDVPRHIGLHGKD